MTGEIDPPPAHEHRRDGPYAMNLCIMLTDVEPGENAATALVPGTHTSTIDSRWGTLFETPFRLAKDPSRSGLNFFLRWNILNNILRAKSFANVTGAFGKQGDLYFFPNGEVWHGRLPNMHGRRVMIYSRNGRGRQECSIRFGRTYREAPPSLARHLAGPFQTNDMTSTIVNRIYSSRRATPLFGLEYWSKLERRVAEWISTLISSAS